MKIKHLKLDQSLTVAQLGSIPQVDINNTTCRMFSKSRRIHGKDVSDFALVTKTPEITSLGFRDAQAEKRNEFLLLVNKKTNVATAYGLKQISRVGPILEGTFAREENKVNLLEDKSAYWTERNKLTMMFGVGRKRRAVESHQKNRALLTEHMATKVIDTAINIAPTVVTKKAATGTEETSEVLPPCDRSATEPRKVYDLNDIITESEFELLEPLASELANIDRLELIRRKEEGTIPLYICHKLQMGLPSLSKPRIRKASLLVYLDILLKMYKMRAVQLGTAHVLGMNVPKRIVSKVYAMFTTKVQEAQKRPKYMYPQYMREKCLAQILILCLFLDEFSVDLTYLVKDLKCSSDKISRAAMLLGCHVKKTKEAGSIPTIVLTLPLFNFKPIKRRAQNKVRA